MPTEIFIIVYRSPIEGRDYYKNRHAALWVNSSDGFYTLLGLEGIHGSFELVERPFNNPWESDIKEHDHKVTTVAEEIASKDRIIDVLKRTEVNNDPKDTGDYDCRKWVLDVLMNLETNGYLTEAERKAALDAMIGFVMGAKDEEGAFAFSTCYQFNSHRDTNLALD